MLCIFTASADSAILLDKQVYGPYGNQRYNSGSMGTTKGYTGQYGDATGLDYYNARFYDAVVGLFISADTVQDTMHGFDPYAYVQGNPETRTDPTGHCWPWCTIIAGAIVGALTVEIGGLIAGQQPSWEQVAGGALIGATVATIGVVVVEAAAAAGAAGGLWSAGAAAGIISGSTWGTTLGTALTLGIITPTKCATSLHN